MKIYAVRGAVSVEKDEEEQIVHETASLMENLMKQNKLSAKKLVSIQFTITPDLQGLNPAAALRKATDIYNQVPLFVSQEPVSLNSPPRMIRILLTYYAGFMHKPQAVYLGDAAKLRPDLANPK